MNIRSLTPIAKVSGLLYTLIWVVSISFPYQLMAQQAAVHNSQDIQTEKLQQAEYLFSQHLYRDCLDRLQEWGDMALSSSEQERLECLKALATAGLNDSDSEYLLKRFLSEYPTSTYAAEIKLALGTHYLYNNQSDLALNVLQQINVAEIKPTEQPLLFFRLGQALIENKNYREARPYFIAIEKSGNSDFATEATYYVAYLDYEEQNYDQALKRFRALPSSKKYNTTVPYYIVQILYRQQKWDETLSQSLQLLSQSTTTIEQKNELNRIIGECYMQKGRAREAMQYLSAYITEAEQVIASSAYNCGVLAAQEGNHDLAVRALTKAIEVNDCDLTGQKSFMLLGQTYMNQGEFSRARMAFERAATLVADAKIREEAAYNHAVVVHETAFSPFNEEVSLFENFLNEYPNSPYADNASTYLSDVYTTTHNYEAALASIAKIRKPSIKIQTAKQRLLYRLAVQEFINENRDRAIVLFSECINMGKLNLNTLGEAHYWRGEAYYMNGQYPLAAKDFEKFLAIKPQSDASHLASGYYNLGYTKYKQQDFSGALEALGKYVAQPSERNTAPYIDATTRMADCYYYLRNFNQAENYYSIAANDNGTPSADYAVYQKAFMQGLQKKYTAKIDNLDILIRNYPESEYLDEAYLEKGKTYLILGNNEYAIKSFQEVTSHFYNSQSAPEAGLQLALVYYNTGRVNEAIDAYKNIITLHPGSEEAQTALDDLKNIYVERNQVADYASYIQQIDGKMPMSLGEQDSLTYIAATRLIANGKTQEAEKALKDYLVVYPNGQFALNANISLARATHKEGRWEEALKYYDAITNMPGSEYTDEALMAMAEIHQEQQNYEKAFDIYQQLVVRTDQAEHKRKALMGSTRMAAQLGKHEDVVLNFTQLNSDTHLSETLRQEGKLLRGKSLMEMKELKYAIDDLKEASADTRSMYGAEAKYQLAQLYFDDNQTAEAETQVFQLINSGTPHQYWLARAFILLADIYIQKGDTFQAKQYLQSLQSNYNSNEEINQMIEQRINLCK